MADYTIRECRGQQDAEQQYELWLRATANLPRAWRSCVENVRYQLQHTERYPRCRLFAERPDETLIGYIGTHPPFEWIAADHGPPAENLGWAIPFGFPWTHPFDTDLEVALYDEMIRITPEIYADFKRDIYIQRFRESWTRHLEFLEQRGWRRHARIPLLGHEVQVNAASSHEPTLVTREDFSLISHLSTADDTAVESWSVQDVQQRYDGGWIVHDTFWHLGERGAFALEQRGPWAAVTVLFTQPGAFDDTLQAAAAQALQLRAKEIYFTMEPHETRRRQALEIRGFHEVDAGVYYVRDAD